MPNEFLFILETVVVFGSLLIIKKILGKWGVFAWIPIVAILANLQVTKSINLFGLDTTLGNVLFASSFLATDIISECYGKKLAKKAVIASSAFMVFFLVVTQITLAFNPNAFDMAQEPMESLFTLSFRVTAASLFMYILANISDVVLFDKLSKITKGKHLWLRNNVCTIVCNCLENFGFTFLAFYGIMEVPELLSICFGTCIIEAVIALIDTPFAYAARKIHTKEEKEKCLN